MTSLALRSVAKRFGGVVAADDVTLDIPAGAVTGLIGPNGAGKTTIVNLITGMLSLSSGEIWLGEQNLTTAPAHVIGRAGVGRTFQNIHLLAEATVLDNVMIGRHRLERSSLLDGILNLPPARQETIASRERARDLLAKFGMADLSAHPASALAYGHQRRVEIMRALASEPKVLLLDEPVAGMNDVEADELGVIFRSLANSGVAVLLIEHNMRFVTGLCDHIYVLDRGSLIAQGTAAEVVGNSCVVDAYLGG